MWLPRGMPKTVGLGEGVGKAAAKTHSGVLWRAGSRLEALQKAASGMEPGGRGHGPAMEATRGWSADFDEWQARVAEWGELRELQASYSAGDPEEQALAAELQVAEAHSEAAAERALGLVAQTALSDGSDSHEDLDRDVILEVRAGTGGQEAMLFTAEMLAMYRAYAQRQRWRWESVSESSSELGGLREAAATIRGGAFGRLRFESGVHRVQRVPTTEKLGRIHTSTVTVAIMPVPEETDVRLEPRDLRIDTYRASGRGGQHVNTTDSAVRIVHIPTGMIVAIQDERSQHQNKAKALELLRARLYEQQREKRAAERAATRRSQIGAAARSERIRTYNFPQNRVTDHRVNVSVLDLQGFMDGELLDDLIDPLALADAEQSLLDALYELEAKMSQAVSMNSL